MSELLSISFKCRHEMAHAVKAGYIMLYVVVIVRKKTSELNETRPKDRVRNTFIFKRTVRVIVGVTLEYS